MVLFLFMGLFGISINTIADATVSDTFKNKKGYYLNIAHVFFGLGAMTSPIVFNFVFSMTSDFRSVYFILFIIALVVVFLISMAKYPSVEDEKIRPSVVSGFLKNRNFMILCLYSLLTSGAMHSISGWIPTLFQKNLGISASVSNYSLSFFWLSIVIARTATAFLSKKYQERQLLKILNIIIFIVLAVSFFFDNYWVLLADYMLTGLLMGGTFPLMIAYSAEIFPKYSTSRLAVIFSFSAIGMFSIPALVGIIADIFPIYKILPFTSLPFLVYFFVFGGDAKKHSGYKESLKR
jgi:fucose permease